MIEPRFTSNFTLKLLDNVVRNDETKTDALRVHASGIL